MSVVIVDYGVGNLASIANMFRKVGSASVVSGDPQVIASAERIVLPGVGAFDAGMSKLQASGLLPILERRVHNDRVPVLGICLGMQLLTKRSEEGKLPGLGWIDAETVRFPTENNGERLRVPHMRWNVVQWQRNAPIVDGLEDAARFYFVHSYYVRANDGDAVLGTARHGVEFCAAVHRDNIFGMQFHPEKSHRYGMKLLANFVACR